MKFKHENSGRVFDTDDPMYSDTSLLASVARVFTNSHYRVTSVAVEQDDWDKVAKYTRLPDTRVVYEIRACAPSTYRAIGEWIEVTEDEYRSSLGNMYFQCRDREIRVH